MSLAAYLADCSQVEAARRLAAMLGLATDGGAILSGVASALRHRDDVPALLPRMADFAAWVSAAEPRCGLIVGPVG